MRNEDVITEVTGLPTASYEDLFELTEVLLSSSTAELTLERGAKTITLRYHRGGGGSTKP